MSTGSVCRVLLADDTEEIRMLLRMTLEAEGGFQIVGEATDGAQALHLADDHRPDAVLLDLAMPVMDGLEAIPAIRRATPETKIVVLSGFNSEQMEHEALAVGADAYLEKGVHPQEIIRTLHKVCAPSALTPTPQTETEQASPRARDHVTEIAMGTIDVKDPISALAHELMTPVSVVQGFAEAIQKRAQEISDEKILEWAEAVTRNASNIVNIVRSFRFAEEIDPDPIQVAQERFDAAEVARETVSDLRTMIGEREVNLALKEGVTGMGDPVKIRQVLTNLISNAIKFSDGAIDLEIEPDKFYLQYSIADRGAGVPEHLAGDLFKRFSRLGSEQPGSGLGLYLSKRLARAHGGDLVYRPRPGGGATFKLRIPLAE